MKSSKHVINDAGQIAGGIATIKYNGVYSKQHCAALWDPEIGVIQMDTNLNSIAKALNDKGNVAVSFFNTQKGKQTFYWEPMSDCLVDGPSGEAKCIDQEDNILIFTSSNGVEKFSYLWKPVNGTVFDSFLVQAINTKGEIVIVDKKAVLNGDIYFVNKNKSILFRHEGNLILLKKEKSILLKSLEHQATIAFG